MTQLGLKLRQLQHEVGVGRDDVSASPDVVEGVVEASGGGVHEVGEADGGRAADASPAVDQYLASSLLLLLCYRTEGDGLSLVFGLNAKSSVSVRLTV